MKSNNTLKKCNYKGNKHFTLSSSCILGDEARKFFLGYFNNHMTLLLGAIQFVKEQDTSFMYRRELFIDDLEHHFIEPHADALVFDALHWLKEYLRRYPRVMKSECLEALQKVRVIYDFFGLPLDIKFSVRILKNTRRINMSRAYVCTEK